MTYYHDPSGHFRNVAYHVEPEVERQYAAAETESIQAVIDAAVARGAIAMDDREQWVARLRREPELVREVLDSLAGDRSYAEGPRARIPGCSTLAHQWLGYTDATDDVRAYDDTAGLTESERLYRKLAEMTNEHSFVR